MRNTKSRQEAINQSSISPSECDIAFFVFWSRIGTPIAIDGKQYQSGTHFELINALSSQDTQTIIYRRIGIYLDIDDEVLLQYKSITKFFESDMFYNTDGSIKRVYNSYKSFDEFQGMFSGHFSNLLEKTLEKLDIANR